MHAAKRGKGYVRKQRLIWLFAVLLLVGQVGFAVHYASHASTPGTVCPTCAAGHQPAHVPVQAVPATVYTVSVHTVLPKTPLVAAPRITILRVRGPPLSA